MSRITASLLLVVALLSAPAGRAAADQNDPRLDTLFEALAADPGPWEASRLEASIWHIWLEHDDISIIGVMNLGTRHLAIGDLDRALEVFDRVVDLEPAYAEGWNKRATTLFLKGRFEESLADVERTLELEPRHFGALSGAGQIHSLRGEAEAAIRAYEAALAIHPYLRGPRRDLQRLLRARPRI